MNLAAVWKLRRAVRDREQPLGAVDAGRRAVRLRRPGRPRRRLRHAGRDRRRQRRARRARRRGPGGRPGPGRQGPGAARVQDVPHAGPRGGVGHRLRAGRAARGLGGPRPDRPLRGPPRRRRGLARPAHERDRAARRGAGRGRRPRRRRADRRRCRRRPPAPRLARVLRPAGAAAGGPVGSPARRRPVTPPRPATSTPSATPCASRWRPTTGWCCSARTSRLRRGVQGDRGPGRRVRHRPGAQHADHRVRRHRRRAGAGARRLPAGGRDAVRRLRHVRLQPAGQQRRHHPLPLGRGACRWWCACRSAAGWAPGRSTRRTSRRGSATSPGLKVVAPATPADAKGLLLAALDDGNPVLVLEHKRLYRSARGPVPAGPPRRAASAGPASPDPAATPRSYLRRRRGVGARPRPTRWRPRAAATSRSSTCGRCRPWDRDDGARLGAAHVAGAGAARGRRSRAASAPRSPRPSAPRRSPGSTPRSAGSGGLDTPIPFAPTLEAVWSAEARLRPALDDLLAF